MLLEKNSLRKQVIARLKDKHPELYIKSKWRYWVNAINFLNQRSNFWLIFLIVIACYALFAYCPYLVGPSQLKYIGLIRFEDIKSAATLIDQRTSNTATIISMTLAVTAILLSNMAIKEGLVYDLLYKRSKLNLIIFYTLSVIASLIIVGTTKDSYPKDQPLYFYRGVLTGTYLVLVVLIMIGHLFKVVYEFSNSSGVKTMLVEGFFSEAQEHLKKEIMQDASSVEQKKMLELAGFTEFFYRAAYAGGMTQVKIEGYRKVARTTPKYIHDVNLEKMAKVTGSPKLPAVRFYRKFTVDQLMDNYDHCLFLDLENEAEAKTNVSFTQALVLKPEHKLPTLKRDFRKYFAQKLNDAVENERRNEVSEILGHYKKIFENELKYKSRK